MSTYGEMQADIIDELSDQGLVTATHVQKAILRSIAHYARKMFWFNQATADFFTTPTQEFYDQDDLAEIPDMVRIHSMYVVSGGVNCKLRDVENESIVSNQIESYYGTPSLLHIGKVKSGFTLIQTRNTKSRLISPSD